MFLLRSFVNERLTTAIEEILGVVEHTVADYENEVSRLKKEVRCLRGQLDILQPVIKIPRADIRQITGPESEEKGPPEWYHYEQVPGPSLDREDGEPIQTKVELQNPEEQEDSMATLIKEEEEHLDINELPEGGVIKLVLPLCPVSGISGFYPVLTPDCTPARSGNSDFNEKQKQYRARRDADPVRRQRYLERAAENQRQYRARRDTDPVRRQQYLEREKERWREDRRTGKAKIPMSNKERGARFRAKKNEDPVAKEEFLDRRRASYHRRKEAGKTGHQPVRGLNTSGADKRREQWRRSQRSRRERLTQMHALMNLTPESIDGDNLEENPVHRQEPEQWHPPQPSPHL